MSDATSAASNYPQLRRMMVDCQVRPFDVTDQRVLGALLAVPRELFVGVNEAIAYSDAPLTLTGSTEKRRLLAPMVLARLLQNAALTPTCRVLDVAGATGYSAAVMTYLAAHVVALESDAQFTRQAKANFATLGLTNVEAVTGPLTTGAPGQGLYDVILVNGSAEQGLDGLLSRLAPGGRLLVIRRAPGQSGLAAKATRFDNVGGKFSSRSLFEASAPTLAPFIAAPAFTF